jgi:hypothetical protein
VTPPHGEYPQQPYGQQPYPPPGKGYDQGYGQGYGYGPGQGYGPAYGAPGYGMANYGPPPDNNLVWAILSTVLCCMPLGIVSIIKATQVSTLWSQGQLDAARRTADEARKWAMWSAIVSLILYVVIVAGYVVFFVALAANSGVN